MVHRIWSLAFLYVLIFASAATAQTTAAVSGGNWKELLATVINTAGVIVVVQVIKYLLPVLKVQYGWAIPLIATVAGPGVAALQSLVAGWLGVQVDFTPIVAALTGAAATAAHQVAHQATAQAKAQRIAGK